MVVVNLYEIVSSVAINDDMSEQTYQTFSLE